MFINIRDYIKGNMLYTINNQFYTKSWVILRLMRIQHTYKLNNIIIVYG